MRPTRLGTLRPAVVGETEGLDANTLAEKIKHYLTNEEVKAVMARREKIVAQFCTESSDH